MTTEVNDLLTKIVIGNEDLARLHAAVNDPSGTYTDANDNVVSNLRARLDAVGYDVPVAFTSGISVSESTTTVTYNGHTYAADPAAVPFTTTATFDTAQWVLILGAPEFDSYADFIASNWTGAAGTQVFIPSINAIYEATDATGDVTNAGGQEFRAVTRRTKKSQPSVIDVFLIYGQSNAQGQPASTTGALDWINPLGEMYDGTDIVDLTNSMPTPNGGTFGGSAWQAFANEYIERTGRRCLFANCANGSQSIADLSKGAGNTNYSELVAWHDEVVAAIVARNDTVGNVSILFNQGERDQVLDTPYETYYTALDQLWADIKADTGATKMFIWTLGLYLSADVRGAWPVQQSQRTFCADKSDVILAYDHLGGFNSSNGLSDNTHYTMAGYNLMGRMGAQTVAGVLFDNGTEGDHLPAQHGQLLHSSFQRQHRASCTISKIADGDWNFGNTTGPSASFIDVIDSTTDPEELRLYVAGPVRQFLEFSVAMEQDYALRGLEACARINYDTDENGDDYIGVSFRMVEVPLRVNMSAGTIDVDTLGVSWASLLDSISATFPSTGNVTITHTDQLGLPLGAIRGDVGRELRVNSSGSGTTYLRLRDSGGVLVNDEVTCALRSVVLPLADVPVGATLSVGLTYSTYRT